MRQGRLWNSRGGLAALANDSYGELTLGSWPFPQPCSATLAVAELEISCFAFGRSPCQLSCGLLVSQCSSGCLGVWSYVSVQPCAHTTSRVVQVQFFCVA